MKLILQLPCYNEEFALPRTLAALPKTIPGYDSVETLLIDDGSSDRSVEVARAHGITHVVSLKPHQGLARTFMAGLQAAIELGADTIINVDSDNQYCADDIGKLVEPILQGRSGVVIGERPLDELPYFNAHKKRLHRWGNQVIAALCGLPVNDATSGFRALSKEVAARMRITSRYTYTVEMLFYLRHERIPVCFVPIRVNHEVLRPSRLIKSNTSYIMRTLGIILRCLVSQRLKPSTIAGGNHYPKYKSRNPLARMLVAGFLRRFDQLVTRAGGREVFECGCGEGVLSLRLLSRGYQVTGCDINATIVRQANDAASAQGFGTPFFVRNIMDDNRREIADLIICCEALEHMQEPEKTLQKLSELSRGHVLLSVPHEPLWRMMNIARMAYLADGGNTPGHIQHWSLTAFKTMVGKYFDIVEIRTPFPWIFILCRKRT